MPRKKLFFYFIVKGDAVSLHLPDAKGFDTVKAFVKRNGLADGRYKFFGFSDSTGFPDIEGLSDHESAD